MAIEMRDQGGKEVRLLGYFLGSSRSLGLRAVQEIAGGGRRVVRHNCVFVPCLASIRGGGRKFVLEYKMCVRPLGGALAAFDLSGNNFHDHLGDLYLK